MREEVRVFDFAVGVDIDDGDVVLYCHGSRALGMEWNIGLGDWRDEGAGALRREDVLDTDRDRRETLLYCEVMEYLRAVKSIARSAEFADLTSANAYVSSLASLGSIDGNTVAVGTLVGSLFIVSLSVTED